VHWVACRLIRTRTQALETYTRPSMLKIQLALTLSRHRQAKMKREIAEQQDAYVKRKLEDAQAKVRPWGSGSNENSSIV
jgi:hypothetical protein